MKLFSYNIFFTFFSSCVEEKKLCNGISQCANKNDLKWCKNGTSWTLPNNWVVPKVFENLNKEYSVCSSDNKPPGQLILKEKNDDRQYDCIERSDENPFKKSKRTDTVEKKTWLQLVHEPCESNDDRRCIGQGASQCTYMGCKSNFSLIT